MTSPSRARTQSGMTRSSSRQQAYRAAIECTAPLEAIIAGRYVETEQNSDNVVLTLAKGGR
jgi:hypothetical protein